MEALFTEDSHKRLCQQHALFKYEDIKIKKILISRTSFFASGQDPRPYKARNI